MSTGLKGDEGALIGAAVAGKSLEDIAQIADVSVSTVQRRLRDPEIAERSEKAAPIANVRLWVGSTRT